MAKVEEEVSTAAQNAGADDADALARYTGPPVPAPRPQGHFLVRFWRSAVGKKWVMAVSGIVLLGYVLAHMVGNLKVFLGKSHINLYGEWLRTLGEPALPRTVVLWGMRITLIHALKHSIQPIEASFARLWPEARLMNLLDDSLSADLARDHTLDNVGQLRLQSFSHHRPKHFADHPFERVGARDFRLHDQRGQGRELRAARLGRFLGDQRGFRLGFGRHNRRSFGRGTVGRRAR